MNTVAHYPYNIKTISPISLVDYVGEITMLRSKIDALADKWNAAKKAGHDLNHDDKSTLLALLIKERLLGTVTPGYEVK